MIDVIIPVYNTPLTDLERCLDSILKQSFNNYKVYIIDDGSNNEVRDYLDSFSKAKDNFIVKHKENAGVSSARNLGIEISDSPYITFVDSDDVIEKDFLAEAYKLITENNLDIIIGGYNEIKNNKIVKTRLSLPGLHIYENERINILSDKLAVIKKDAKFIIVDKKIVHEFWESENYTPNYIFASLWKHLSSYAEVDKIKFHLKAVDPGHVQWLHFTYNENHYDIVYGYGNF